MWGREMREPLVMIGSAMECDVLFVDECQTLENTPQDLWLPMATVKAENKAVLRCA